MSVDVIVGLQRGDEGKGRFVDLEAAEYDIIARGNGGANAGHTVVPEGLEPIALHQIPSGIAYSDKLNIIGNGVYLDPVKLVDEIAVVEAAGIAVSRDKLLISNIAHLVLPHHVLMDELRENGSKSQGSTKSGIAYVASDKYLREGLRVEDVAEPHTLFNTAWAGLLEVNATRPKKEQAKPEALGEQAGRWADAVEALKKYVGDSVEVVNDRIAKGDRVLAEGAQAFWLDINHGMYPAVTSSSTTVSGLLDGLGIAPKHLDKVTGVAKVVKSHVGGGPFVTEITDEVLAEHIRGSRGAVDGEYGATTGRARRIGYLDFVELRRAIRVNGVDNLVLSKTDHISRYGKMALIANAYILDGEVERTAPSSARDLERCVPEYEALPTWDCAGATSYDELPKEAKCFKEFTEAELDTRVTMLGVGPERNQAIACP